MSRGLALRALAEDLRAEAAMMARLRSIDTPAPLAALAAAALKPMCLVAMVTASEAWPVQQLHPVNP